MAFIEAIPRKFQNHVPQTLGRRFLETLLLGHFPLKYSTIVAAGRYYPLVIVSESDIGYVR